MSIVNSLLNMFFVSLPEEIFVVVIILIGLKRDDLLDFRMLRYNLKWIITPALAMSAIVNFLSIKPYSQLIGMISLYILTLFIIKQNNILKNEIKYIKVFAYSILGFAIIAILENIYCPIILSLTKTTITFVNDHFIYNFLLALPARIVEYCILALLLVKLKNDIRIRLFDTVLKDNFFKFSMICILLIAMFITIYLIRLIGVDLVLINKSLLEQLMVVVIIFIAPTIIITWILLAVNRILKFEKRIQQTYENLAMQDDVMFDVEDYNEGGEINENK